MALRTIPTSSGIMDAMATSPHAVSEDPRIARTPTQEQLEAMNAYWRAANYLTVGQIYLRENPLLTEPLRPGHIKPRLLGHWGTSPGLSLIYVHLIRLIRDVGANAIYLAGHGHGGPALLATAYRAAPYSEI